MYENEMKADFFLKKNAGQQFHSPLIGINRKKSHLFQEVSTLWGSVKLNPLNQFA